MVQRAGRRGGALRGAERGMTGDVVRVTAPRERKGGGEDGVTPPRLTSLPLLSGLKHDAISPSTAEQRQFGVFRT